MTAWHSPQSIYSLGHRAVKDIFTVKVQLQEKVDGSFFAFGLFPEIDTGEGPLRIRSKGAVMLPDAPEKMFVLAAKAAKERVGMLHEGWQYRGEFLAKPKHNALAYNRAPKDNIILFDILTAEETYLSYDELKAEGDRISLEVVPQLATDVYITSAEEVRSFLSRDSILGGQKIEGVVIKPLTELYGPDKKMLMSKFVSEAYKEVHDKAWKQANPGSGDILTRLGEKYAHPGRWMKAAQHLREAGLLENSPRDIPKLFIEVQKDLGKEEEDAIKHLLWKWAWPHLSRASTRGLPEWWKNELLKLQFETESTAADSSTLEGEDVGDTVSAIGAKLDGDPGLF